MPTVHVKPEGVEPLQLIADSLWKARKVIVITGAGISTNSGIPDFRSENGLYSMIQTQFDEARLLGTSGPHGTSTPNAIEGRTDVPPEDLQDDARPAKRRRVSPEPIPTASRNVPDPSSSEAVSGAPECVHEDGGDRDQPGSQVEPDETATAAPVDATPVDNARDRSQSPKLDIPSSPPGPRDDALAPPHDGSPPPDADTSLSEPQIRSPGRDCSPTLPSNPRQLPSLRCTASKSAPASPGPIITLSSPLSSPPPVLYDPFGTETSSPLSSDQPSSASSEAGDTPPSTAPTSLASKSGHRSSLPNMKGKDLFDVSVWADPLKTSVFYTFTTTLRRKVKEVEPTTTHHFLSHLRDRGKLVRCYTQNIDEIEGKVGLSTSLGLGPGSKARFSTRSSRLSAPAALDRSASDPGSMRTSPSRGVECVYLHGSLNSLRCFVCSQTSNWEEADRENQTMSGRQPACPHCVGAAAAREGRGKRALGVGKLRPDIVLYGEEHPNAHLISPIVQHDLSLNPDMLLILGTSLRVHGLKVMVREFAKAVHNRGGTVVFVNLTKPPESVWSDILDYWIEWDCDAWVNDLKSKKPILWLPPGTVLEEDQKGGSKRTTRPRKPPAPPRAPKLRDDKTNTAHLIWNIHATLAKIGGRPNVYAQSVLNPLGLAASLRKKTATKRLSSSAENPGGEERPKKKRRGEASSAAAPAPASATKAAKSTKATKPPRAEKAATVRTPKPAVPKKPAAKKGTKATAKGPSANGKVKAHTKVEIEVKQQPVKEAGGLNELPLPPPPAVEDVKGPQALLELRPTPVDDGSIAGAIKSNPRKRKPKMIDGVEVSVAGLLGRRSLPPPRPPPGTLSIPAPPVHLPVPGVAFGNENTPLDAGPAVHPLAKDHAIQNSFPAFDTGRPYHTHDILPPPNPSPGHIAPYVARADILQLGPLVPMSRGNSSNGGRGRNPFSRPNRPSQQEQEDFGYTTYQLAPLLNLDQEGHSGSPHQPAPWHSAPRPAPLEPSPAAFLPRLGASNAPPPHHPQYPQHENQQVQEQQYHHHHSEAWSFGGPGRSSPVRHVGDPFFLSQPLIRAMDPHPPPPTRPQQYHHFSPPRNPEPPPPWLAAPRPILPKPDDGAQGMPPPDPDSDFAAAAAAAARRLEVDLATEAALALSSMKVGGA